MEIEERLIPGIEKMVSSRARGLRFERFLTRAGFNCVETERPHDNCPSFQVSRIVFMPDAFDFKQHHARFFHLELETAIG